LSTYIMRADSIGRAFTDALASAMKRGVDVKVLIDGVGSGYFLAPAYARLRRRGIPVGRFMHPPLPWRMPFLNLRNHKKLLVADGRIAFVGGLNIGDENMRCGEPGERVLDTHFQIEGPLARALIADFAQDWSFVTGEGLSGADWFSATNAVGTVSARAIPSGPDEDIEKIEFVMLQAFACAQRSIRLMTPYFLPSEVVVRSLSMAAMRGVEVEIILPDESNHRTVDWATRAHVQPLLQDGVCIWENPPPFDNFETFGRRR
jgi:cardiolipin synthase